MKYSKWRQRLRGTFKWGGVMLCVVLFALWLMTGWWTWIVYRHPDDEVGMILYVNYGGISLRRTSSPYSPNFFGQAQGITSDRHRLRWTWDVDGEWDSLNDWNVRIPLWLPFLLIALPTGYLFWSDHRRRVRVRCCEKCGYDLTGSTMGRCPECGAEPVVVKKS